MKTINILVVLRSVFWIFVAGFSLLLAHNAMLYFTHGGDYGILPEKILARKDILWNLAFYIHLPFGTFCLLAPLALIQRRVLPSGLHLHQKIGRLYTWITLLVVCPTGLYLALYAKGGLTTQTGFFLQGGLLAYYTYQGYRAIKTGNKSSHADFMMRSYSIAAVVLTFRIFHIAFFLLDVPYQDNYALSQWLGLSVNLLVAEVMVYFRKKTQRPSFT